jgi:thiol-disulfide isomerase/thioredoxin
MLSVFTPSTAFSQLEPAFKDEPKVKKYLAEWIRLPDIEGSLANGEADILKHRKVYVYVVFFLASWCIPCQNFTADLKKLENEFAPLNVRFKYIFNHDLQSDMKGYIKAHRLNKDNAILATNDTLLSYRDPTLPAIFVADKHGWIVNRFMGTKQKALDATELRNALDHLILK